jgi:hypothetical protein
MTTLYDLTGHTSEWTHPGEQALRERIKILEAIIREADACFNEGGKPGTIESASLALVRMCHEGRSALDQVELSCTWTFDNDFDHPFWGGECGAEWCFEDGGPAENEVKFCPFCGRRVVVAETPEESDNE